MRIRTFLLASLALSLFATPLASAGAIEDITGEMHCALPTSVECIQDWVDAVFDGRWVRIILCLAGDPHCPYAA